MKKEPSTREMRELAEEMDVALENKDREFILSCFCAECEIEFLEVKLSGKKGVKKWLDWMDDNFREVKLDTVTQAIEGNVLFKEYVLSGRLSDGTRIKSRQTEVVEFEGLAVKSLRLYFDRFDFSDMVAKRFAAKKIVKEITRKSLKGLT